jgi:uncharacterized protein
MEPRLSALHVYPIKSTTALDPGEAAVEPWGIAGDRRWMVIGADGRALTQRDLPRLALVRASPRGDGSMLLQAPGMEPGTVAVPEAVEPVPVRVFDDSLVAVPAAAPAGAWFSRYLGRDVRLVHLDDPKRRPVDPAYALPGETVSLADGFPLLLTTTASLAALNALIADGSPGHEELPMRRFRPNVVIDGTAPWAEDGWTRVRVGEVDFRVAKPCGRCVVTTVDQSTAERGREPLRTLARHRRRGGRPIFGQNLVPLTTGTLRVGDPFTVLA